MFTFVVNNDTIKVIGLINPCYRPNQKPAGSGPVSLRRSIARSFGRC